MAAGLNLAEYLSKGVADLVKDAMRATLTNPAENQGTLSGAPW